MKNGQDVGCVLQFFGNFKIVLCPPLTAAVARQYGDEDGRLTNIFLNLEKYVLRFGQIHFVIWTNTFYNSDKYIFVLCPSLTAAARRYRGENDRLKEISRR